MREKAQLEQRFVESAKLGDASLAEAKAAQQSLGTELSNTKAKLESTLADLEKERAARAALVASAAAREAELAREAQRLASELAAAKKGAAESDKKASQLSEQLDATILALQQKSEDEATARQEADARGAALETLRGKHEALLAAIEANRAKRQAAEAAAAAASAKGRPGPGVVPPPAGKFAPRNR